MLTTALIIMVAVTVFRVINPPIATQKKSPATEAGLAGLSALPMPIEE